METFREFWGQELSSGWTHTTDWAEATLSGSWLSLPGGDARFVVGAVWRPIGSVRLHSNPSASYIIPTARDKLEDPSNFFIGQAFRCERKVDWAELAGRDDCPGNLLRLQNPDGSLATTPGESFIYFSHLVFGGNPNILSEHGESISVGVEFTPQAIPGLSLNLTWRSVDYTNKIVRSTGRDDVPHYVGVDPADVYAFIFPDPSGSDAYYADRRVVNAAAWTNEGLDLEARYDWSTDRGSWSIDALITQNSSLYKDIGDGSEPYDYVGDVEANRRIWALAPEYRGTLSVGFDSADQRWSAWLSAVHTSVVSSTFSF